MKIRITRSYRCKAFTLVELLIGFSLFIVISFIAISVLSNTIRSAKKLRAQVFLYSETEALMELISGLVRDNAVDYEGYYSRNVLGGTGWAGSNYGKYGQSFVHPGSGSGSGPDGTGPYNGIIGYGAYCPDGTSTYPDDCPDSVPIQSSLDTDTGTHPFSGINLINATYMDDPTFMNAMCQSKKGNKDCEAIKYFKHNELLLINGDGDERIALVKEQSNFAGTSFRLSKVLLRGTDSNNDGIEDDWTCDSHYTCNGADGGPDASDLTNVEDPPEDFIPMSPVALSVVDFYVFISPIEDPYRAFGESDFEVQEQPKVTVILKTTLSDAFSGGILGDLPVVSIQKTISTGITHEIKSYGQ